MEEEENGPDYTMGFKNKSIDKINGQTQAMKGVTGTAPTKQNGISDIDQKYFDSIKKFTSDKSSGYFGGVQGYKVKSALQQGDYAAAGQAMKQLKSSNPEAFKLLNDYGVKSSGFSRGGRYSDKSQTMTGEVKQAKGGGYTRTDKKFDPKTQTTTKSTYRFDD
jgi:hypothetical protein